MKTQAGFIRMEQTEVNSKHNVPVHNIEFKHHHHLTVHRRIWPRSNHINDIYRAVLTLVSSSKASQICGLHIKLYNDAHLFSDNNHLIIRLEFL